MGATLSEKTTSRVIVSVLAMLLLFPFLQYNFEDFSQEEATVLLQRYNFERPVGWEHSVDYIKKSMGTYADGKCIDKQKCFHRLHLLFRLKHCLTLFIALLRCRFSPVDVPANYTE